MTRVTDRGCWSSIVTSSAFQIISETNPIIFIEQNIDLAVSKPAITVYFSIFHVFDTIYHWNHWLEVKIATLLIWLRRVILGILRTYSRIPYKSRFILCTFGSANCASAVCVIHRFVASISNIVEFCWLRLRLGHQTVPPTCVSCHVLGSHLQLITHTRWRIGMHSLTHAPPRHAVTLWRCHVMLPTWRWDSRHTLPPTWHLAYLLYVLIIL